LSTWLGFPGVDPSKFGKCNWDFWQICTANLDLHLLCAVLIINVLPEPLCTCLYVYTFVYLLFGARCSIEHHVLFYIRLQTNHYHINMKRVWMNVGFMCLCLIFRWLFNTDLFFSEFFKKSGYLYANLSNEQREENLIGEKAIIYTQHAVGYLPSGSTIVMIMTRKIREYIVETQNTIFRLYIFA
jgi:hypothetical protein